MLRTFKHFNHFGIKFGFSYVCFLAPMFLQGSVSSLLNGKADCRLGEVTASYAVVWTSFT